VSAKRLVRLIEELAAMKDLPGAAEAAGYEDVEQARSELLQWSRQLGSTRSPGRAPARRKAEDLPPPCPRSSPFGSSSPAVANTDGASRGNPGPAAYGCVYSTADGVVLCGEGAAFGVATNNVAEYRGAIAALERLLRWKVDRVVLRLDSQLVVRQLNGSYRVKDAGLKPLHARAMELIARFSSVELQHVPRAENALADRLANQALDEERGAS